MQTTQTLEASIASVLVLATSHSDVAGSNSNSGTIKASLLPLRKACDSCRRRKTRCDRKTPCNACEVSCLKCEYLVVHQRRGPKRRRIRDANTPKSSHHLPSNDESSITSDSSLSPAASEKVVLDTPPKQSVYVDIHRPRSTFEGPRGISSDSPIEGFSDNYHDYTQADSPGAYHTFINNVTDNLVAQNPINDKNPSTKNLAGNAFMSELPLSSSSFIIPAGELDDINKIDPTFSVFAPYIKLFLEFLYPIMPIFDRNTLVADLTFRIDDPETLSLGEIAMFSALSAAVIMQLNLVAEDEDSTSKEVQESPLHSDGAYGTPPKAKPMTQVIANSFISQCLSFRQQSDFIDSPEISWIITSFFLFVYYGHLERHTSAWYYLREAIGQALELKLDVEESYNTIESCESQRRRRLFWLLFITERGYALQRRRTVILQPSISLPLIFGSEDPCLLYGFVNLAILFKFVDGKFSHMWGDDSKLSTDGKPIQNAEELSSWLVSFQENISRVHIPLSESIETQKVDIMVTREWLHMLAWQMCVRLGLLSTCSGVKRNTFLHLKYPFVLAKDLVTIILGTGTKSLEFHGIGMEQKISEIAICLTDVMTCTCSGLDPDLNNLRNGETYLRIFLGLLSKFRGQRSSYLDVVLIKALPFISNTPCKQLSDLGEVLANPEGKYNENKTSQIPSRDEDVSADYISL